MSLILRPFLFILYTNLLIGSAGGRVCQYADNTSLLLADRSLAELFGDCTRTSAVMAVWCRNNSSKLNNDKTFGKRKGNNESFLVTLNYRSIPVVELV